MTREPAREPARRRPADAVRAAAANHPPEPDRLGDPTTSVSVWNAANALTMFRVVLVPVFVVLLVQDGGHDPVWRAFAWAVFSVASISDRFDGMLARRHGLVTDFGKLVDPIADKALMGAALIGLSALGDLPWWVTVVVLAREIGITLMRFWVIRHGIIPASRGGKAKTLLQGSAIGMYVLVMTGPLASVRWWVMAAAVVLTVVTGLDYVVKAFRMRGGAGAGTHADSAAATDTDTGAGQAAPAHGRAGAEPTETGGITGHDGGEGFGGGSGTAGRDGRNTVARG